MLERAFITIVALGLSTGAFAQATSPPPDAPRPIDIRESLWLEELTWMEVRDLMKAGQDHGHHRDGWSRAEWTLSRGGQAQLRAAGHLSRDRQEARKRPLRADRSFRARR